MAGTPTGARRAACWLGLAAWLAACGPEGGEAHSKGGTKVAEPQLAADAADAVAQVGAQTISRSEVEALVAGTGLSPRRALAQLEVERLLSAEALRRGYGDDPRVVREAVKASAHALLEEAVEATAGPADVPQARFRAALDKAVQKHTLPERRRADHILFHVGKRAIAEGRATARRGAEQALIELQQAAGDVDAVLERYRGTKRYGGRVNVEVESLPPLRLGGAVEAAFTEAVFAAAAPGPLPELVQTSHGYHAVVLREILPPVAADRDALAERVRKRLVTQLRRERLAALLEGLEQRVSVEYDDAAIAAAFQDSSAQDAP